MAWSFSSTCIKYLMFIFNLLFVISGIILLSVGAVIQASYYNYRDFLDNGFLSIPALLIAVGAIIFIVSFFGCCGAYKENYCMIVTFCTCLVLIFILELSGGIAGYLAKDRAAEMLNTTFDITMKNYNTSNATRDLWDDTQKNLHCCGDAHGAEGWINIYGSIPDSCCPDIQPCIQKNTYNLTCVAALEHEIVSHAAVLGGVGIGLAMVQLLGIIFACKLASSIRKDYESV